MTQLRLPLVAFVAALLISFLRDPAGLWLPTLHCEDGPDMFGFYYNNRGLDGLWAMRAGYLSLLPNMIGYAVGALPTTWIAPALVVAPLLLAALALSAFSWPQFRGLVADDRHRALVCVVLAAMPLGNFVLLTNTTYSQNSLLLLVVLFSLGNMPAGRAAMAVQTALVALAIPCHPLTSLAIPVYLVQIYRWRRSRAHVVAYGVLLATAVVYFLTATEGTEERTFDLLAAARYTLGYVGLRVVLHTVVGMDARIWFETNTTPVVFWAVPVLCVLVFAGLVVRALRRGDRPMLGWLLGTGYYAVTFSAAAIVIRPLSATLDWNHRYSYIQSVLCALLALGSLHRCGTRVRRVVLLFALPMLLVWTNFHNNRYYRVHEVTPGQGEKVDRFVGELSEREAATMRGDRVRLRLERGNWSIDIDRVKDW